MLMRFIAAGLLCTLCLAAAAVGQDTSALINQALDQPVKVQLDSVLPEAMNTIGKVTGVRMEASPAVWDLLPWGQQTNINAKIENQTLRQALDVITRKLGLIYVLKDESIELQPMPALQRLGRRATIQELQSLDFVSACPLGLKLEHPTAKQVAEAADAKLSESRSAFAIEYRPGDVVRPDKTLSIPRNATIAEALEILSKETDLTWYPWGKTLLVVPKEEQVRAQLAKTLTLRFPGVEVSQVLSELAERAGVPFEIEPGAIQRVPPEFRSVHLMLDNSSLAQALETIGGFTGLGYVVTPRGIYIWNQSATPAAGRDPMVGMIALPGSDLQILVPQSQVPPDVREFLKYRTQKELEKLRQLMAEQGFHPSTTQPAPPAQPTPPAQPASQRLDQFKNAQ